MSWYVFPIMSLLSWCHLYLKEVSSIFTVVHMNNKENFLCTTFMYFYVTVSHIIGLLCWRSHRLHKSKSQNYESQITTNPMLSCKTPTKKMARKNLMHSLPGADWLQAQEQLAWWAAIWEMERDISNGCKEKQSPSFLAEHPPQMWGLPQATTCTMFTDLLQKYCAQSFNRSISARPYTPCSYSDRRDHHTSNFTLQKLPWVFQ